MQYKEFGKSLEFDLQALNCVIIQGIEQSISVGIPRGKKNYLTSVESDWGVS